LRPPSNGEIHHLGGAVTVCNLAWGATFFGNFFFRNGAPIIANISPDLSDVTSRNLSDSVGNDFVIDFGGVDGMNPIKSGTRLRLAVEAAVTVKHFALRRVEVPI
jgi:hypothetical protein